MAAALGRAGHATVLVDPHAVYPADFRAEKIDGTQAAVLGRTGVGDSVLRAATRDGESWVARFGRLIERRPGDQHGILYDTMVNTMRGEIPPGVAFIPAKVMDVATSAERQTVTLSTGEQISARLVIVANGLNVGLRHKLGMERRDISKTHSIMLGFDLVPHAPSFPFPASDLMNPKWLRAAGAPYEAPNIIRRAPSPRLRRPAPYEKTFHCRWEICLPRRGLS